MKVAFRILADQVSRNFKQLQQTSLFWLKRIRRKILTPVYIHLHTLIVTGSITKIFMVFEVQSLNQIDIEPRTCLILWHFLCHSVKSQCLNSLIASGQLGGNLWRAVRNLWPWRLSTEAKFIKISRKAMLITIRF